MPEITPEQVAEHDALRAELARLVKSSYCVNQKHPPSYDRKWSLFVRFNDGSSETLIGPDDQAGSTPLYRRAIRMAVARNLTETV